ncbi:MAG: cobalt transport protein CbiN [Methanospirillum sp.]|nr:cobalt transport protein CbiN [Methanospirillum sp.]
MLRKYWFEILAAVAIVVFVGVFLATAVLNPDAEFGGSDGEGSGVISEITGIPEEDFEPLVPQWEPPSGEIESGLFALLAAIGGIVVGYGFGQWRGQRKDAPAPVSETARDINV